MALPRVESESEPWARISFHSWVDSHARPCSSLASWALHAYEYNNKATRGLSVGRALYKVVRSPLCRLKGSLCRCHVAAVRAIRALEYATGAWKFCVPGGTEEALEAKGSGKAVTLEARGSGKAAVTLEAGAPEARAVRNVVEPLGSHAEELGIDAARRDVASRLSRAREQLSRGGAAGGL